jgi:hypothetical protein
MDLIVGWGLDQKQSQRKDEACHHNTEALLDDKPCSVLAVAFTCNQTDHDSSVSNQRAVSRAS